MINLHQSMIGQRFTSRDDLPYCAECFAELFSKRCTACTKPITGNIFTFTINFFIIEFFNISFLNISFFTNNFVNISFFTSNFFIVSRGDIDNIR